MLKRLFKGEADNVFKNMLTLLVGSGFARIIGIISIPILARVYSPEDFGVLALYTAFVAILAPVMTLRYVQAIPLPKTDVMAFNLFSVCFKLIALLSLVLTVILAVWGELILGWFDMQALLPWWWLVVLGAIGAAIYETFSLWSIRKNKYKVIAKTQIYQSLIGNLAKIGLGLLVFKPGGLIVGQFLSQSSGITIFLKDTITDFKTYLPKRKLSKERLVANYYQEFVWYRLPSQFLMVLALHAPVLIAARLYGSNITGQLSFTIMALSLPVTLVGMSISQAYYAEIASIGRRNPKKIKRITFDLQRKLFLLAIPISLFIYLFSEWMFVLVFGEQWRVAGQYASILSPFLLLKFTSTPLDQVFNVIGKQSIYLVINLTRIIGYLIVYLVCLRVNFEDLRFVFILSWFLAGHYLFVTALVIHFINLAIVKKI